MRLEWGRGRSLGEPESSQPAILSSDGSGRARREREEQKTWAVAEVHHRTGNASQVHNVFFDCRWALFRYRAAKGESRRLRCNLDPRALKGASELELPESHRSRGRVQEVVEGVPVGAIATKGVLGDNKNS